MLGDLLLRAPVEEHGTERLVAAVIRMRGPGEELPVRGAVQDGCSLGVVRRFSGKGRAPDEARPPADRRRAAGNRGRNPPFSTTQFHPGRAHRRDDCRERTDNSRDNPPGDPALTSQNVSRFPLCGNRGSMLTPLGRRLGPKDSSDPVPSPAGWINRVIVRIDLEHCPGGRTALK
jgi:hypothetical protein